jgi:hypothetical protein
MRTDPDRLRNLLRVPGGRKNLRRRVCEHDRSFHGLRWRVVRSLSRAGSRHEPLQRTGWNLRVHLRYRGTLDGERRPVRLRHGLEELWRFILCGHHPGQRVRRHDL